MNIFGQVIKVSIFGESHGQMIGLTISGLPSGINLDLDLIQNNLNLRKSDGITGTKRIENDEFEIISGYYNHHTTGTPLTFIIKNQNQQSKDYLDLKNIPRPSHSDLGNYYRYGDFYDFRGGGHSSGRLTALIVILGSISEQLLKQKDIMVLSHIYSLKDIKDDNISDYIKNDNLINELRTSQFPVINHDTKQQMIAEILTQKEQGDSVGGIIETIILNFPPGYGEPFFYSIESYLSSLIFSIPGIKGIEFGKGFDITYLTGSQANDQYYYKDRKIKTKQNNNGGIVGGISIGEAITFKTAIKPTSSIAITQQSINLKTKENTSLNIKGRHDPAIISRISPIINALTYYGLLDIICIKDGTTWIN